MFILEHIVLSIKVLVMSLVQDIPAAVQEGVARQCVGAATVLSTGRPNPIFPIEYRLQDQGSPPCAGDGINAVVDSEDAVNLSSGGLHAQSDLLAEPSTSSSSSSSASRDPRVEASRLAAAATTHFGFNPSTLVAIICVPALLQYYGLSVWIYMPISAAYLLYMQMLKERNDRMAARGILSDPGVLKSVVKDMPSWVNNSDCETAEWLNGTLNVLWPRISIAVEKIVKDSLQTAISQNQLPGIMKFCELKEASLGTVPPRITSIKFVNSSEPLARLDIQLVWAGRPEVPLICVAPLLTQLISNLRIVFPFL